MATVYLARDQKHDRPVAIKVLAPQLSATIGATRFIQEIRIAAQLQHPHILGLIDSGQVDDTVFHVMPFVEGESLRDRLSGGRPMPIPDAVRIIREVADGLSHAHARGVIHRDIKPENVMLSGRHALIVDFGVAKALTDASDREHLTTVGIALGTPTYMAPEQAAAEPGIDHRVDIHALGVMAYEMLAGHPPFGGMSHQQVIAAHMTRTPPPLTGARPAIAPALEQVVMRCLAKDPAGRYQNAEDVFAAQPTPRRASAAPRRHHRRGRHRRCCGCRVVGGCGPAGGGPHLQHRQVHPVHVGRRARDPACPLARWQARGICGRQLAAHADLHPPGGRRPHHRALGRFQLGRDAAPLVA